MLDAAHARAFTVAKVMDVDILRDIRHGLLDALQQGHTLQTFEANLKPLLQAKGWWGKDVVVDPDTLDAQLVQLGSSRRLKTIYQTNLQSAYMAGRHKRQQQADAFPYMMYVAVMDSRTRPSHAALNGRVFAKDDPIWDSHYPPNGYNCRCRTRALTRGQVEREARQVESSEGRLLTREANAGVDRVTGEVAKTTQRGIRLRDPITGRDTVMWTDPGFNASPAASHLMDALLYQRAAAAFGLPQALAWVGDVLASAPRRRAWRAFVDNTLAFGRVQHQTTTLGVLPAAVARAQAEAGGSPVLHVDDTLLVGPKARRHARRGDALSAIQWADLPDRLPGATWYRDTRTGDLVAWIEPDIQLSVSATGRVDTAYLDAAAREKIRSGRWQRVE